MMEQVIMFASVMTPIVTGLTEVAKRTFLIPKRFVNIFSLMIGLVVGLLAFPLTDLDWTLRTWAGTMAGLAATGLYEVGKYRVPPRQK
ncbi:holin [Pseudalkalibacillus sp. SCS-8]|uniref:holin n=1 Tax=Pseudalkalibacillus nanhaiensis TaxID=3115291 RepID=UPI0032D9DC64